MALAALLSRARESVEYRRAKHNARADLDLVAALVRLRVQAGLSQQELAESIGVSQQAVSKFERLGNDPKLSTVRQYADAVGALVCHTVDRDLGQLEQGGIAAVSVRIPTPVSHGFVAKANPGTYSADPDKRARFAMAA